MILAQSVKKAEEKKTNSLSNTIILSLKKVKIILAQYTTYPRSWPIR